MQQQEVKKNRLNIYQIPKLSISQDNNNENTVIGLFDSSGSMSSYWTYQAEKWNQIAEKLNRVFVITFSTKANLENSYVLRSRIQDYQASSTEIYQCFFTMIQKIFKENKIVTKNITILFFSDGQDNNTSTINQRLSQLNNEFREIKKSYTVSFICIGIGNGFPTFLGMQLREYLHSGDEAIPPIFQVETDKNYKQSYDEQFDLIRQYLIQVSSFQVVPNLALFPWQPQQLTDKLYAGQIIGTSSDVEQIVGIDESKNKKIFYPLQQIEGTQVIAIARSWLQKLQIDSLKDSVQAQAKQAIEYIRELEQIVITSSMTQEKPSVMSRIMKKSAQLWKEDFRMLLNQFKELDKQILSQLTPYEAAKRLAIGNKVGKYHDSSMKFCGVDRQIYYQMRDEVVDLLLQGKIDLLNSQQERSVISLQCIKDILAEPDLAQALKICPSQYDLVEIVPLVGQALLIKRFDGMLVNPWLTEVIKVARHHKTVDTVSIYDSPNRILRLNTGDGDVEEINAVLPLFCIGDKDLIPFYRSRFFNILMTFNMLQNADCCYDTSHAALSANLILYLIQQKPSEWRDQLIKQVQYMFSTKYELEEDFNAMKSTMLGATPSLALVNDHPNLSHRCEDASKALIMLLDLMSTKLELIKPNIKTIVHRIIGEIIGRLYPSHEPLYKFFDYDLGPINAINQEEFSTKIIDLLKDQVFNSRIELIKNINEQVIKSYRNYNIDFKPQIATDKLNFLQYKYKISTFECIYRFFLGTEFKTDTLICLLYHAYTYQNSYKRNSVNIDLNLNMVLQALNDQILMDFAPIKKIQTSIFESMKQKISRGNQSSFHNLITPISLKDLKKYCSDNNIDIYSLKYNKKSNITHQACLSEGCQEYLQTQYCYRAHYNMFFPVKYKFFEIVKSMCHDSTDQILIKLQSGIFGGNITKFANKNYQECLDLLEHLVQVYQEIEKQE